MGKFNEKKFGSEFKNILRIIKIEKIYKIEKPTEE